jgi:hypothetical protein
MSSFGKVLGTIGLVAAAVVGLGMSLCGGVFTVGGLSGQGMYPVLVIAIPSLIVGLALVWFAAKKLRAPARNPPER